VLAAAALLRVEAPDWCVRVVHVTDLLVLGIPQKYPLLSANRASIGCFPFIAHVFKFMDTRRRSSSGCENGRTTTPFDMLVKNRCSRYHLVIQAAQKIGMRNHSEKH
jgi:xylulose-5-phosphate/fructose-6-phosphate phosphoketolase